MRSSDCATHILLLLCEIVRFLRMECLPFDDDGDDYIGIEDTMTNGIERNKAERVPSLDSRRFSRMNSTVLSRSSIHAK